MPASASDAVVASKPRNPVKKAQVLDPSAKGHELISEAGEALQAVPQEGSVLEVHALRGLCHLAFEILDRPVSTALEEAARHRDGGFVFLGRGTAAAWRQTRAQVGPEAPRGAARIEDLELVVEEDRRVPGQGR